MCKTVAEDMRVYLLRNDVAIYNIYLNSNIVVVLFVYPPVLVTNEHYSLMHDEHCVYKHSKVLCFRGPY